MSRVVRKTKTKEKNRVSSQYGVADPDPADLDVKQTRNKKYQAKPPQTGGTWEDKYQRRQGSESPIFMSTTSADAMSTDEAMEISKKIDEEVEKEKQQGKIQIEQTPMLGEDDTLPTVEEIQSPKSEGGVYEEINEDIETSGIVTFHPRHHEKVKGFTEREKKEKKKTQEGGRVPFSSAADREQLLEVGKVPPLTYGDDIDFDRILQEGDEFISRTYSMLDEQKENEESMSFVILSKGTEDRDSIPQSYKDSGNMSTELYENITQELKEIMPFELYLPVTDNPKITDREPKLWIKHTPFEGNPAVIIQMEEWLQEFGTRDYAVDAKIGVIYAIKGKRWDRLGPKAFVSKEPVGKGTPVMGPIDKPVHSPDSKQPVPVAESTRKDPTVYSNVPPEAESLPRPDPKYSQIPLTPKRKLDFGDVTDEEENEGIEEDIEEARRAEEALVQERDRIETERLKLLKDQQDVNRARVIALRQQRKRLEESIAQMSQEMSQAQNIDYKDRLTRRQNLINEYQNQIDREEQVVEDFIDNLDEIKEITMETMTTDSALSSTADPVEFLDEEALMKVKLKQIRAEQCKSRSVKMYKHFIRKAQKLKDSKEKQHMEELMLATLKSLRRKIEKYQKVLSSHEEREVQYFSALEKYTQEAEEKAKLQEEEVRVREKQRLAKIEIEKMKNEERIAGQKREELELKIAQERQRQVHKAEKLEKERERLKRLQREKEEKLLTAKFLEKERKERDEQERKLTEKFLEEERTREEQRQQALAREFLERERKEIENQEKEKAQKLNKPFPTTVKGTGEKGETRKRTSKPSTSEQEEDKQKLFDLLNEVVVNGTKTKKTPSKLKKDLRWDYEQDRKAQAIFGKINKRQGKDPIAKCPKCGVLEHDGECPCSICGKKGHLGEDCPSQKQSPPTKKRRDINPKQEDMGICICCESEGHLAEECPWKKETIPQNKNEYGVGKEKYQDKICQHCRALDHSVRDCPALKLADQRRRKVKCERCGEIGHDIVDCLDESDIRIEKEIKQAIDRKQKELNEINRRLQEIKKVRETKEPQEKDTNSAPEQKYRPPRKRTQAEKSSRDQNDQTPNKGSEPPKDTGQAGGGPPDDPGGSDDDGSDDEDDSDDDDDEEGDDEEDTEKEEEEETMSEISDETEISGGIYDLKGRRVNMEEIIEEWQNRERDRKPVKIIRGPRGHRGPRGRQGPKGHRGKVGPAGSFIDSGISGMGTTLDTSGLENSFKQLGDSMKDVWQVQKTLNTSMRDHIQLTAKAQRQNAEALERLNQSTRQRDHDHMFMAIEPYDGTDPKKFEPWIEQIEIACRISNRDPRVVVLAKSIGAVTEVVRSMRQGLSWVEFKNELKRCFSENKTRVHAAALFDNLRKQEDNENLRSYIHKYSKLHREATGISCEEEFDTQKKLHFLSRLRNSNISVKISQSAEFEKFDRYSLTDCMEKALLLESRLQIRETVTQAREAVDAKTPEVMEVDAKVIEKEEEINTIPEDKPMNRSKATSICFKCGDYGYYGKECTVEDKDLEDFANKIVGRIEHTFQAYTPITLQYMNDIVTKAAKLDQSRRIAKTKARLLQGILNQRGGAKGVPKTPSNRGRGRGTQGQPPAGQQVQTQGPPAGRSRGRGGANFVAKKQRQPTPPPPQLIPLTPSAPPVPIEPQPSKPLKVEPNPFLADTSHLPEIHEVNEEEIDEELEGLTLKQLEELQHTIDQELDEPQDDQYNDTEDQ